jgi:death-on-curing family protein
MPGVYYLTRQDVEQAVEFSGIFGGGGLAHLSDCISDRIEAALAAPRTGFGDFEKYASLPEKAAALLYAIAKGHPCPTGNKRLAFVLAVMFLNDNGLFLWCEPDEVTTRLEAIAASDASLADAVRVEAAVWIANHAIDNTEAQVRIQAGMLPGTNP